MSDTNNPGQLTPPADVNSDGQFYSGTEPFFAFFTQAQVIINGLRMTFDEQIAQPVSDLASRIEAIRRKFRHDGDVHRALDEVGKIATKLDQRIQAWESEAQRRENNKTKMSGEKIQKMKVEFTQVRMKSRVARRTLTKLNIELYQISAGELPTAEYDVARRNKEISVEEAEAAKKKRLESINIVNPILLKLFNDDLCLNDTAARFSASEYPKGKEEVWDPGYNAFLVAGWYMSQRTHRSGNDLDLDVWLIPKDPVTATALSLLAPEINVALRTPGQLGRPLEFVSMTALTDVLPRADQLGKFVGLVKQNNFDRSNLEMKVLRARMPFAMRKGSFHRLDFKPFSPDKEP